MIGFRDPGTTLRLTFFWRLAFGAATLTVTVMSLLPVDALPTMPDISDRIQHTLAYAVLAVLACLGWHSAPALPIVLAGLIVLGGALEIGQSYVPSRFGEWPDFFANMIGVFAGYALMKFLRRLIGTR